jgi:formate-dependent nitrite reductase cytochrome c552 subunit
MTGWHPQGGFPYEGGYLGAGTTPDLGSVGCESCHGPGGAHVAAETGTNQNLKQKLQNVMALGRDEAKARVCTSCHDVNNSPDFDYEAYWPDVAHPQGR